VKKEQKERGSEGGVGQKQHCHQAKKGTKNPDLLRERGTMAKEFPPNFGDMGNN